MNLDQIRHSFETLQHLQPPLLRKIPPLCRAIEEGQLDNTEYVKPVIKMLQQWAAAQTALAEALPQPDAAQLTTLPALESWLQAHDGSTQLRQFLAVTGRMDNLTAALRPYQEKAQDILNGDLDDPDFVSALAIFVDIVVNGFDFTDPTVADKTQALEQQLDRMICLPLYAGQFQLDLDQVPPATAAPAPTPTPAPIPTSIPAPLQPAAPTDRHPLTPVDAALCTLPLEQSGASATEFNGKTFGDLLTRNRPLKLIMSAMAKYYVLSFDQLKELVAISEKKLRTPLLDLINRGYIDRYRYRESDVEFHPVFTIGKVCAQRSPGRVVAQYTLDAFHDQPSEEVLHAAIHSLATMLSALKRSTFLCALAPYEDAITVQYPTVGRRFGSVTVTSANTVWFLAPFFDAPNVVRQAAAFKQALMQIPEAEVVLLYAQDEETAGDWNVALSDAKVSLQNIFYFTQDGTVLTHGLETVPMDTVLLLAEQEEPVYEAPVTLPSETVTLEEPAEELEEESIQDEPAAEPEEAPIQEELVDEPEEEPVDAPVAEPVQEEPVAEPEEEPVPEEPADEPEEPVTEPKEAPVPEAPAAPARVPIDLSKLPELPVRDNKIDVTNGIFKGIAYPGQDGSPDAVQIPLQLITQNAAPSALLYARSLVRCAPTLWRPVYQMLAYAYNDPLADCDYNFVNLQTVYEDAIPGCSAETAFRFQLCAFLRMLFADEIDPSSLHLLKAPIIEHYFQDCVLFQKLPALPGLLQEICTFIQHFQKGFGVRAAQQINGIDDMTAQKASLQKRASELLDLPLQECHSPHPRVKALREKLFSRNGVMKTLIRPVAEGQTDHLEEGVVFCQDYQTTRGGERQFDEKALNDLIDKLWAETSTLNSRRKSEPLLNSQKIPIRNNCKEFIDVFLHWAELAQRNSNESDAYLIARNRMLNSLNELDSQITQLDKEPRLGEYAGLVALSDAIADIKAILSGQRHVHQFFYLDFVTSNQVELDTETTLPLLDESVSILPDYTLWERVRNHEATKISLAAYTEQVMEGRAMREFDFGRQLILLRYLRTLDTLPEDVTLEKINALEEQVTANIEAMPQEVRRMENSFNAEMEMAEGYDRFIELGTKDRILHEFREWYRPVADHGCNYGFYHRKMDACCAAVNAASEQLKGQYRERLMELRNTLPVSVLENQENNILDVISDLIEERVYSVADDYMRMAAEGQTTPPVSYMLSGSTTDYLGQFLGSYDDLFRTYGISAGRPLYDLYTDYNPENSDRNRIQKDARNMLRSWPRSQWRGEQNGRLKDFLAELDLDIQDITDLDSEKLSTAVTIEAPAYSISEYEHPIALFGTRLSKDGFTLQLMFGRADREMILNKIRSYGSTGNPIILLLDYALSLPERRAIASMLKREGINTRTTLLIDRILAVFLAGIPKMGRMKALLQTALPFGRLNPYQISGAAVPPEMFMGRREELNSILNPNGTHIIYGGRQLGKSALLFRAKDQIDNRAMGYWGVVISLLNQSSAEVPASICQELTQIHFFPESPHCADWDSLCNAIRERMNDEETPVHRLLLLLDEADAFTKSADSNLVIDQLLNLQAVTDNRFKFVLAGLHNVLRYSRQALDDNQSFIRLSPTCIKPLKYVEGSELLEKPLFYLGFRMQPEHVALISQILSTCNYYPGLIHYYAYHLIDNMANAQQMGREEPPYYLDETQIRNLLQDPKFNKQIIDKLFITLGVDAKEGSHYKILAYALAHCCLEDVEGASFGFTAAELMHVCEQFNIASIVNLGEHTVQALLEEMTEMNVLRASQDHALFSFNRRNFLEMMGDMETIWKELEGFADAATV